jgi:hypothetical protein
MKERFAALGAGREDGELTGRAGQVVGWFGGEGMGSASGVCPTAAMAVLGQRRRQGPLDFRQAAR